MKWRGYTEFYRIWSPYRIAIDNSNCIQLVIWDKYSQLELYDMALDDLKDIKHSLMLEF